MKSRNPIITCACGCGSTVRVRSPELKQWLKLGRKWFYSKSHNIAYNTKPTKTDALRNEQGLT